MVPAHRVLVLVGAPDSVSVAPLPVQLSAVALLAVEDGPSAWALHPHGRPGGGTWLLASDQHSTLAMVAIWGVNQWKEGLSLSLSLTKSACQKRKKERKKISKGIL